MDVTNTCCKHIYTKICYCLTFVRICALASSDNAIFLTTN